MATLWAQKCGEPCTSRRDGGQSLSTLSNRIGRAGKGADSLPKTTRHPQGCLMRLLESRRQRITASCSCQASQIAHAQIAHVATQKLRRAARRMSPTLRYSRWRKSEASSPGSSLPQILVRFSSTADQPDITGFLSQHLKRAQLGLLRIAQTIVGTVNRSLLVSLDP